MKANELLKLSGLLFFTKESLRQLEEDDNSLDFNLKYWLKIGKIISLKKGYYILKERWEKETDKDSYLEYLANKIYEPSYLSTEYVMNKYALLTEAVYGITSISIKKPKVFNNDLGKFSYYSISPRLFLGYKINKFYSASVFMAEKTKAVFDYLYLRFLKITPINQKIITELRINWENINLKELKKIQEYVELSRSLRVEEVINLIKKIYYV